MGEVTLQDLCFALEQRAHGEFPSSGGGGPLDPRVPGNVCEIPPTSAIDCAVARNLCRPGQAAFDACATQGQGGVQANVGQPQVAGGAQVIPGSIAYYPCPAPVPWGVRIRLAELAAGCCHTDHGHHDHHHGGCACGTNPCTC